MTSLPAHPLIPDDEVFLRMTRTERIQHLILIGTFLVLILTGFPLLFPTVRVFRMILSLKNAFVVRGLLHRAAAVLLVADLVWHLGYATLSGRGRRLLRGMIPRGKDLRDAVHQFGHNLGLSELLYRKGALRRFFDRHPFWRFETPPEYGRYDFVQKFEYWAVAWGSAVMIVSGFFMWNVDLSLRLFPLWVHDVFVIVHGYEAVLAFLAIIVWHMYNVHLNAEVFPMSRIWLDGRITARQLRTLHPLEYQEILAARLTASNEPAYGGASDPGLSES